MLLNRIHDRHSVLQNKYVINNYLHVDIYANGIFLVVKFDFTIYFLFSFSKNNLQAWKILK
jgi:hypothetical protein